MYKNILIVASKTKIDLKHFNNENNYIIGVERGCLDLISKNIKIDLAISDFDHVLEDELEIIKLKSVKFQKLNSEKDLLDGECAIQKAIEIDSKANIIFISKPTKRYDMNFSIINLVYKYGIKFINDDSIIMRLKKGINYLNFEDLQVYTYISFFTNQKANISIQNMKYNIRNFGLLPFENSCISNALLLGKNPIIESENEILLIATK